MTKILIPPALVCIGLSLIVFFYFMVPGFNFLPFPFNLGGIIIAVFGFSIMGKAQNQFKERNTTLTFDQSSFFVRDGLFKKSRNPMYLGMFLFLLGIGICFRNLFSIITPFCFFFIIHAFYIPVEEKLMKNTFNDQYLEYKKTVPKWF